MGSVVNQGVLALASNNLTYPAVGVTAAGRGVIAFTLLGADNFPSAAYVGVDALAGAGPIHIAASGLGPEDGFTAYVAEVGSNSRNRWGDYGAAVADGKNVWIASEYIGQTCTFTQYISVPFGSCSGTRTTLGNWAHGSLRSLRSIGLLNLLEECRARRWPGARLRGPSRLVFFESRDGW